MLEIFFGRVYGKNDGPVGTPMLNQHAVEMPNNKCEQIQLNQYNHIAINLK